MTATEQADVLAAMLRIAEGDIRAKDEQHALLQQIIATNEKEIGAKNRRIVELEVHVGAQQKEIDEFKRLFDKYLAKAEAARGASVFQRRRNAGGADEDLLAGTAGLDALETSLASAVGGGSRPNHATLQHLGQPNALRVESGAEQQQSVAERLGLPPAMSPPRLDDASSPPRRVLPGRPDDEILPPPSTVEEDTRLAGLSPALAATSLGSSIDRDALNDTDLHLEAELQ